MASDRSDDGPQVVDGGDAATASDTLELALPEKFNVPPEGSEPPPSTRPGPNAEPVKSVEPPKRRHWMDYVTVWTGVVALLVNGLGAGFVVLQLYQTRQSIGANTLEQIYGRMHDINKFFVEHPELKPYFYEGKDIDDPNPLIAALGLNEARVKAQVAPLAEMMCDFFAQALIELRHLPPEAYEGWKNFIKDVYKNSPQMRRYYHANMAWYQYKDAAEIFDAADAEMARAGGK